MAEIYISDFVAFLDSIFYEGYAEQLAVEFPADFDKEYILYLENYIIKN